MAILTVEILKKIIENIPEDYSVEYDNKKLFRLSATGLKLTLVVKN